MSFGLGSEQPLFIATNQISTDAPLSWISTNRLKADNHVKAGDIIINNCKYAAKK